MVKIFHALILCSLLLRTSAKSHSLLCPCLWSENCPVKQMVTVFYLLDFSSLPQETAFKQSCSVGKGKPKIVFFSLMAKVLSFPLLFSTANIKANIYKAHRSSPLWLPVDYYYTTLVSLELCIGVFLHTVRNQMLKERTPIRSDNVFILLWCKGIRDSIVQTNRACQ